MKIEITIEPPRALRGRRRRVVLAIAGLVLALAVGVPIAWASDLFGDVPNTNPFHDDIGAIARAGVTRGCSTTTPPNYCPADNVTREAMAAFMHRGFGRVAWTPGNNFSFTGGGANQTVVSKDITVGLPAGAVTGAAGFVLATSTLSLTPSALTCSADPCRFTVWLELDGARISESSFLSIPATGVSSSVDTSVTGVGTVTTPGSHTVTVHLFQANGPASTSTIRVDSNLSLLYAPFGSTGTNALSH